MHESALGLNNRVFVQNEVSTHAWFAQGEPLEKLWKASGPILRWVGTFCQSARLCLELLTKRK